MPLEVGSAFGTFELRREGVREASDEIIAHLNDVRAGSGRFVRDIEETNARITQSYVNMGVALRGLNPFSTLIASAADAYKQVVGGSYIPDLVNESISEIERLRASVGRIKAFSPLAADAAEAAKTTQSRMVEIEHRAEQLQAKLDAIGLDKSQMGQFFNEHGDFRDSVQMDEADAREQRLNKYARNFGKTASRSEVERRIEGLSGNVDANSQIQRTLDDTSLSINDVQALIEEAKQAQDELDRLNRELLELRESTQGAGFDRIARDLLEAEAAEQSFIATTEKVGAAMREQAAAEARVARLAQVYDRAADAAEKEGISEEHRATAINRAMQIMDAMPEAEARAQAAAEATRAANDEHRLSIERLVDAQRTLDAVLAKQPVEQAKPRAQRGSGANTGGGLSQIEQAEQEALRFAQRKEEAELKAGLERENKLAALEKERQLNAENQAARMAQVQTEADAKKYAADADAQARALEAEQARIARTTAEEIKNAGIVEAIKARSQAKLADKATVDATTVAAQEIKAIGIVEAAQIKADATRDAQRMRIDAQAAARAAKPQQNDAYNELRVEAGMLELFGRRADAVAKLREAQLLVLGDAKLELEIAKEIKRVEDADTRTSSKSSKGQIDDLLQEARLAKNMNDAATATRKYDEAVVIAAGDVQQLTRIENARAEGMARLGQIATRTAQEEIAAARAKAGQLADIKDFTAAYAQLDRAERAAIGNEKELANVMRQRQRIQNQEARANGGGFLSNLFGGAGGGNFLHELMAVTGYGSAAILVFQAFTRTVDQLKESFNSNREIELATKSIGTLLGSVSLGTRSLQEATAWGAKYGITQREIAEAASEASVVMRTSNVDAAKTFEVFGRLQARAPGKTFSDSVRALMELQAGQLASIQRLFNIPQEASQRLAREIRAGADPILALDKLLNELGQTVDVLDARMQGSEGAVNRNRVATSQFTQSLGELIAPTGNNALDFFTLLAQRAKVATDVLNAYNKAQRGDAAPATQNQVDTLKNLRTAAETNPFMKFLQYATGMIVTQERIEKKQKDVNAAIAATPQARDAFEGIVLLSNQLDQGLIRTKGFADALQSLGTKSGLKGSDALGIVAQSQHVGTLENRVSFLTTEFNRLKKEADQTPALQATYVPQLIAIGQEIQNVKAQLPIIAEVDVQIKLTGDVAGIMSGIAERGKQTAQQLGNAWDQYQDRIDKLGQQGAKAQQQYTDAVADARKQNALQGQREAEDYARSQARAWADLNRNQLKAREDFNRGLREQDDDRALAQGRQRQDEARADREAAEDRATSNRRRARDERIADEYELADHNERLAEIDKQLHKDLVNQERDLRRTLQQARRDYDVDEIRDREDYEKKRRRLLAEGKVKEARELKEDYDTDRKRAEEDHMRDTSDTTDDAAFQRTDTVNSAAEQKADTEADFAKAREREKKARALRAQDEAEDLAQQLARQQAGRDLAAAREQEDFDRQRKRAQDNFDRGQAAERENLALQQAQQDADRKIANDRRAEDFQAQLDQLQKNLDDQNKEIGAQMVEAAAEYTKSHDKILADWDTYLAEQKAKITTSINEQIAIMKLVNEKGVEPEMAKALVSLNTAQGQFKELIAQQAGLFAGAGPTDVAAYLTSVGSALGIAGGALRSIVLATPIPNGGPRLPPPPQSVLPAPPPPRRGGDDDSSTFGTRSYTGGQASPYTRWTPGEYTQPPEPRQRWEPQQPDLHVPTPVSVVIPMTLIVDGKPMAGVIQPHIEQAMISGLRVAAQVVDASSTPALQQSAFRRPQ